MKFEDMKLNEKTSQALRLLGYTEPTDVQKKTIPEILSGRDVMVRSKTGSGKTAAFGIPIIERITQGKNKKALVLAPTRELALQICKEIRLLASFYHIRIMVVYGGHGIESEIALLGKGVDVLVATPGRLLDLHRRGALALENFDFVVLDEADRMLDMGFIDDIKTIIGHVAKNRMTHMFSATLDEKIYEIGKRYLRDPLVIEVGEKEKPASIKEESIFLKRMEKSRALANILKENRAKKTIVFVATKIAAEYLWKKMRTEVGNIFFIHGGLSQAKREHTINTFKKMKGGALIATDVASRGLHLDDIEIVINYDEANDAETHLHRIGRTGRMGKEGKAITFVEKDRGELPPASEYVDLSDYYKKGEAPPAHLASQLNSKRRRRSWDRLK